MRGVLRGRRHVAHGRPLRTRRPLRKMAWVMSRPAAATTNRATTSTSESRAVRRDALVAIAVGRHCERGAGELGAHVEAPAPGDRSPRDVPVAGGIGAGRVPRRTAVAGVEAAVRALVRALATRSRFVGRPAPYE